MIKDRLKTLFKSYDPIVRQVIAEVGDIEQEYISMQTPRGIMKDIDDLITKIAREELARLEQEGDDAA